MERFWPLLFINLNLLIMPLGLLGGVANVFATDMTNTSNRAINREQLKAQQEENQKQRDYDWNKMVAQQDWQQKMYEQYNTPSAMKQQYREAGINPFIQGSNAIGSGISDSSPSGGAPGVGSLPSPIAMQAPNMNGIDTFADFFLNKSKVDADVANQEANTVKTYIDAAIKFYEDGKDDAGDKLLNIAMSQHGGYMKSKSLTSQSVRLDVEMKRIDKDSRQFEFDLRQKYGDNQANQLLSNMKAEYDCISSEKDLNRVMERLHNAELDLVSAKTDSERENARRIQAAAKAELASAAAAYAASVASKASARSSNAKAAIEEESKKFLISKLDSEAVQAELRKSNAEADFNSERAWRMAKQSETGQFLTVFRNTVSSAAEAIGGVFSGSISKKVE